MTCRIVALMKAEQRHRLARWRKRRLEERSAPGGPETSVAVDLTGSATADGSQPVAASATPVPPPTRSPAVTNDNPVFLPPFLGARIVTRMQLEEIVGYVNESELFRSHWHLEPDANENESDFRHRMKVMLREQLAAARKQDLFFPRVAYGFFPANSERNDVVIWDDDTRTNERARISLPRQQQAPRIGTADFVKPVGEPDFVAMQIVTMGDRISSEMIEHYAGAIRENYVRLFALGMSLCDALAEYWHRRIRIEWGFADEDGPSLGLLRSGFYRGARCPLPGNEDAVVGLLEADRIGVSAATPDHLQPELTSAALILHHPQASRPR